MTGLASNVFTMINFIFLLIRHHLLLDVSLHSHLTERKKAFITLARLPAEKHMFSEMRFRSGHLLLVFVSSVKQHKNV